VDVERAAILKALHTTHWDKRAAAAILGVRRPALYSKVQRLGIPYKPCIVLLLSGKAPDVLLGLALHVLGPRPVTGLAGDVQLDAFRLLGLGVSRVVLDQNTSWDTVAGVGGSGGRSP